MNITSYEKEHTVDFSKTTETCVKKNCIYDADQKTSMATRSLFLTKAAIVFSGVGTAFAFSMGFPGSGAFLLTLLAINVLILYKSQTKTHLESSKNSNELPISEMNDVENKTEESFMTERQLNQALDKLEKMYE